MGDGALPAEDDGAQAATDIKQIAVITDRSGLVAVPAIDRRGGD